MWFTVYAPYRVGMVPGVEESPEKDEPLRALEEGPLEKEPKGC